MKSIAWNPEKNRQLQRDRQISFEDIVYPMMADGILDTLEPRIRNAIRDRRSMWSMWRGMPISYRSWNRKRKCF